MNVLSLFDGMSCGQIALERAGVKVDNYFASEIDKYAIQVTMHNYPNTIQLGDVQNIDLSELPRIDLLIGGSPCQSFSFAGKREGMATECKQEITTLEQYLKLKSEGFQFKGQSYLFWEFVYILRKLKPKYFLLENVRMAKHWQSVIDKALGVNGILINSALVSAQSRPRVYWSNIRYSTPSDMQIKAKDILQLDVSKKYNYSNKVLKKLKLDNIKCAGMAGYKYEAREVGKFGTLLARHYKGMQNYGYPVVKQKGVFRKLTPIECERLQTVPDNYTVCVSDTNRYAMLGNGWTVDVIAHIFKNIGQEPKPFFKPTLF